jgi:hypothetical protein
MYTDPYRPSAAQQRMSHWLCLLCLQLWDRWAEPAQAAAAAAGQQESAAARTLLAVATLPVQQLLQDLAPPDSRAAEVVATAKTYPLQLRLVPEAPSAYGCSAAQLSGMALAAGEVLRVRVTYTVSTA